MASSQAPYTSEELLAQAHWLGKLARALVRDCADAGDLAQDTMEVALAKPPKSAGPIRPWLAGVARNLARMNYRSDKRRQARELTAPLTAEAIPVDAAMDQLTLQGHVADTVRGLPEPYRETVLLRYYEGLSAADISARIGCPAGTVRWRLKKGMDQLRVDLDSKYGGKRAAWAVVFAPMAKVGSATTTPAVAGKGFLLMSTIWKASAAFGLLLCLYFGGRYFNLWGASDTTAVPEANSELLVREKRGGTAVPGMAHRGQDFSYHVQREPAGTMRIEGQIIDQQERGVAGATVIVSTSLPRRVVSDTYGNFLLENLPQRTLRIEAGVDTMYAGPIEFDLQENTEPIILRLRPAGRVSVQVRGTAGDTIEGALVSLFSVLKYERTGLSDENGKAVLSGVGAGSQVLKVSAAGYAPTLQFVWATGKVDVVQELDVLLKRGARVSGKVVDEKGNGISDVHVWAESSAEPFPVYSRTQDAVTTDDEGKWTIAAVSTGNYRIIATHENFAPESTVPMLLDGTLGREGVLLTMKAGAKVVGKVLNAKGEVVQGAQVRLVARGNISWRSVQLVHSDKNGEYSLTGLRPGIADVVASHREGSSEVLSVKPSADKTTSLDLQLSVKNGLSGTVVDEEGEGVAEAQIALEPVWTRKALQRRNWAVRGSMKVVADAGGQFVFSGLPAGNYRVRALRPGQPAASIWIGNGQEVSAGNNQVQIVLPTPGRIISTLQFEDGRSPGAFFVQVGGGPKTPFVDEDGAFSIAAPKGFHQVRVTGLGIVPKVVKIEVVGETKVDSIVVRSGRSVSGRVVDSNGLAVAKAQVVAGKLLSGDGKNLYIPNESISAHSVESDDEGRYLITGFDQQVLTIVAGKGDARSASLRLPGGNESLHVDLVVKPQGGLSGTIVKDGTPVAQTIIIANPVGATSSNFFVTSGPEGQYSFDQLSPGEYIIFPMLGGGGGGTKDMFLQVAEIRMGEQQIRDMNIVTGRAAFEIVAKNGAGESVPATIVVLQGEVPKGMSLEELRQVSWLSGAGATDEPKAIYLRAALSDAAEVLGVSAGKYTVCAQAFSVDPRDPIAMMMNRSTPNTRHPHCITISIGEGERKKITISLVEKDSD